MDVAAKVVAVVVAAKAAAVVAVAAKAAAVAAVAVRAATAEPARTAPVRPDSNLKIDPVL